MSTTDSLTIDPFAFRQFQESDASRDYSGTVFNISMEEFTKIANSRYDEKELKDGYAPFCKHLFIRNDFTDAKVNVLPITPENESLLRCKYEARNDKELPVLTRRFPKDLVVTPDNPLPVAKYLDLILYSREQINKENEAMGDDSTSDTPWGIVSIKAQDVDYELPMQPITVMRNALGKDQGGSGVPLDREKYMEAFNYWNDHAVVD
eukprot:CAMPEP_0195517264 /NCGR_PEP_ID=MMETSP0794_2-20130614/10271_1 /TAXON_ID=515487 /ORGANISM="Stephanopyxis turris, Strain CCMP 815" /LENGTH=206 /DNA_ID=CAMNT_0040646039 /DNA_START=169 /DNA_END=789 /DNA_ORIENTATION=-